jgi:ABC-type lipoprotein release transport system permease subunit
MQEFLKTIRVGTFLGIRQLRRASIWTTLLIVFIMTLTFLNLVVVSGILVGLIEGAIQQNRSQYSGDVFFSVLDNKNTIERTPQILTTIDNSPYVSKYAVRYVQSATIEGNYQTRRDFNNPADTVSAGLSGIDPVAENNFAQLENSVIEGEFLNPQESGYIVLGSYLLERQSESLADLGLPMLSGVPIGSRVKVSVHGKTQEFIVKGVIKSKVDQLSTRAFITQGDFLRLVERPSLNANEIGIFHDGTITDDQLKQTMLDHGFGQYAKIKTANESVPQFIIQMKDAFGILGAVIGAIGIMVASITIFIVIFINAVTRRKFIGIMKGIGVSPKAIQFSYLIQSFFYGVIGSAIGTLIVYGLLVPLFNKYPIDFPFSDGILVAEPVSTAVKIIILLIVTLIAGYIPARMITKQNTLDSILGR